MDELLDRTVTLIKDYGITGAKLKDQFFLVDEAAINKEIESQQLDNNDIVLEIGPGFGYLTENISKVCRVIAVEMDVKLHSYLINKYELNKNVELINADVLSIIIPKFTKVISNPPYTLVDRIFNKLIHYDFLSGTMILPKSISDSLINGDNKKFPLIQRQFFEFSKIAEVKKESFYPQPRVTSYMVKFSRIPSNLVQEALKREELLVKNAVARAYQETEVQTKRQSRQSYSEIEDKLKDIGEKEVKNLSFDELSQLIDVLKAH